MSLLGAEKILVSDSCSKGITMLPIYKCRQRKLYYFLLGHSFTFAHSWIASLHSTPLVFVISLKHFAPNLFHPASHSASRTVITPSPPHFCPELAGHPLLHLPASTFQILECVNLKPRIEAEITGLLLLLPDLRGRHLYQYHSSNGSQHPGTI